MRLSWKAPFFHDPSSLRCDERESWRRGTRKWIAASAEYFEDLEDSKVIVSRLLPELSAQKFRRQTVHTESTDKFAGLRQGYSPLQRQICLVGASSVVDSQEALAKQLDLKEATTRNTTKYSVPTKMLPIRSSRSFIANWRWNTTQTNQVRNTVRGSEKTGMNFLPLKAILDHKASMASVIAHSGQ